MILLRMPPATVEKIRAIVATVHEETGIDAATLESRNRTERVAHARQLTMALIRRDTDLSLTEIGDLFHRDHGTVIHAVKAVKARVETCEATREIYERLSNH